MKRLVKTICCFVLAAMALAPAAQAQVKDAQVNTPNANESKKIKFIELSDNKLTLEIDGKKEVMPVTPLANPSGLTLSDNKAPKQQKDKKAANPRQLFLTKDHGLIEIDNETKEVKMAELSVPKQFVNLDDLNGMSQTGDAPIKDGVIK